MKTVVLFGNPNAGKSSVFNAISAGGAATGNYAGTTVERLAGRLSGEGPPVELVDTPGTWSLAARSPDERVAIDAALGLAGNPVPDALVLVLDAPRLMRSLYLGLQILELGVPTLVVVNLMDEARDDGRVPDLVALQEELGAEVIGVSARTGEGLGLLPARIREMLAHPEGHLGRAAVTVDPRALPLVEAVAQALPGEWSPGTGARRQALAAWALLSADADGAGPMTEAWPREALVQARTAAATAGVDLDDALIAGRYAWIDARERRFYPTEAEAPSAGWSDRVDRVLLHPLAGSVAFLVVMALIFDGLFRWSGPVVDAVDGAFGAAGSWSAETLTALGAGGPGAWWLSLLGDFVENGLFGGVGAVVVFLPQIALLFFLLGILEDCGYLARAAHLMDRLLRFAGLPGAAFVPLLSGFACAIPAIMATRTLPRFRDRLLTMMVIPLTTCSARLPVYTLVVSALFPETWEGWPFSVRATVLFAMYLFGAGTAVIAAVILGKTVLREESLPVALELPPYRRPQLRNVLRRTWIQSKAFLGEAGRVILIATVVLWALLRFPEPTVNPPAELMNISDEAHRDDALAGWRLEQSFAGQFGKAIEPAIAPLGFDWQIGIGLVGSFAAREVFVSTMGLVYGLGEVDDADDVGLLEKIRQDKKLDGSPRYTALTGFSVLVFFSLAMQCLSTMAVLRRETGGWGWPLFVGAWMTGAAWIGAFVVRQVGLWLS